MRFVPHAYQRYCINRLITDDAVGLFLDMGLGKTVITLTAVNDLRYNRFLINRVLVIAPKKVAEDTWVREAEKWDHLHLIRIVSVLGSEKKRIRALNTPGDIYVLSRDNVSWLVEYYQNAWPFDMVVIDELSSFKSPQAKRFRSLKQIRGHIRRIVGLTGTPAPNGLIDLWAQIYLLDGGRRLGRTLTEYRNTYFTPTSRSRTQIFRYGPLPGAEDQIQDRLRDICISLSAEDYLTLPDRVDNIIHVRLPDKAEDGYRRFEQEMLLEVDEDTIDAGSAAVLTNKLLQYCNGAIYDGEKNIVEVHDSKLEAFREIVEASQGKHILVFYNFQHDRLRLLRALRSSGLRISDLNSPDAIRTWNCGDTDILLAHPASAAYGLNLQAGGNIIIWFGLNWSLELYQQANARLYRQGQKENVIVHHLVTVGCMDERVMEALQDKGQTQEGLLNALKARIRELRKEQR